MQKVGGSQREDLQKEKERRGEEQWDGGGSEEATLKA